MNLREDYHSCGKAESLEVEKSNMRQVFADMVAAGKNEVHKFKMKGKSRRHWLNTQYVDG